MDGVLPFKNTFPQLGESVYIAPGAWVIGDVIIGDRSSVWFNTIVRGDVNYIRIGKETNIQDQSTLHVTTDRFPLNIGSRVTIGHGATVHGCTVEDECLIGIGAIILDGAYIERHAVVAAGAVVTPGTAEEVAKIVQTARHYVKLAEEYIKPRYLNDEKPVRGFLR
ncbi:MAG: gamma carbonic anhydrase family protein [Deltaproteobacteria bacterium]|nr:gamma carbonic anhydrase family protein [Deltaproteobacteria bacterium]